MASCSFGNPVFLGKLGPNIYVNVPVLTVNEKLYSVTCTASILYQSYCSFTKLFFTIMFTGGQKFQNHGKFQENGSTGKKHNIKLKLFSYKYMKAHRSEIPCSSFFKVLGFLTVCSHFSLVCLCFFVSFFVFFIIVSLFLEGGGDGS